MARGAKQGALDVLMNGQRVGRWTMNRGEHLFAYAEEWLHAPHARPLSISMPLRPGSEPYRTKVVQPFFDNLLPDTLEIRKRIAARFGLETNGTFDLLAQIGRDCVGAVQLLPADAPMPDVRTIQGHALTDRAIGKLLGEIRSPSMGALDADDFRISLAGAQEKTALLRHEGRWLIPEGTTPTTHIFKLPLLHDRMAFDMSTSVENEWLCAQLLPLLGVPCARCRMKTFAGRSVLIVERFDRALSPDGSWVMRLPQEDLCQATATASAQKYEADGGPGILTIMKLLNGSRRAGEDREDFFRSQFVFWLLCAIDGHAKNFSLFIEAGGTFRLTPRYDVLSAYPVLGRKQGQLNERKARMAMAAVGKNRHYGWRTIHVTHWLETGRRCGLPRAGLEIIEDVMERVPRAVEAVQAQLPRSFPEAVSAPILEGLRRTTVRAQEALSAVKVRA